MEALASHHFLLEARISICVPKREGNTRSSKYVRSALKDETVASNFAITFDEHMRETVANESDHNLHSNAQRMVDAFRKAEATHLPTETFVARRPWISQDTLDLIRQRNQARITGAHAHETDLNKAIRRSAKADRRKWLDEMLQTGDWSQVRRLRKGVKPHQGRLKDSMGQLVSSDERAETFAKHLEHVQWAVRPVTLAPERPPLDNVLPVKLDAIDHDEVCRAAQRLKKGRAAGLDGVPAEFWQAILVQNSPAAHWVTDFCNECWEAKAIPETWHQARVASIFKKGDPADCDNYRPISLITVGYKLLATILLTRLKVAGAEARIWPSQFGFRSGTGTADALFIARRLIDRAIERKDGRLLLLALDWAKAFDSIAPESLCRALTRFGLPAAFVSMVHGIYQERSFMVRDAGVDSEFHPQHFGIVQGCPLSPFLFTIVMTVLIGDARDHLTNELGVPLTADLPVHELLYADDTLIVETHGPTAERFMECVASMGAEYGLQFNLRKLELLRVNCADNITKADGEVVTAKDAIVYLGGILSADGRVAAELSRRIGAAQADFKALQQVWNHAGIPRQRKLQIYQACVESKLLYCLHTLWLPVSARRRLDGFHARCLRRICGIASSYVSRVTNAEVRRLAGNAGKLSVTLVQRQLLYFGHLARLPPGLLRDSVFEPGTTTLQKSGPRRRGRPRLQWNEEVMRHARLAAGDDGRLRLLLGGGAAVWTTVVRNYCNILNET